MFYSTGPGVLEFKWTIGIKYIMKEIDCFSFNIIHFHNFSIIYTDKVPVMTQTKEHLVKEKAQYS